MRPLVVLAGLVAMLLNCQASIAAGDKIAWPKAIELFQGELAEVNVAAPDVVAIEGLFGKEKIYFYSDGAKSFSGIIGADVAAKPASSRLRLRAKTRAGIEVRNEIPLKILPKSFSQESFNVPPDFDQMTPEKLAEIRREQTAFARAFAAPIPDRLWDAPFIRPVPHQASASSFGRRRIINGAPRAPHSGMDLSAPAGTEVVATNHGKIVLTGDFFFAGGSVVLDHGGGLFTMYLHLSEISVEEGTVIRKGDVLGLSGATGRVTGAHLHWGARVANARVDPLELLKKVSRRRQPAPQSELPSGETEK
jgi:murein DD-endopeptidase MepM/ murein hydrolase activator NlpD